MKDSGSPSFGQLLVWKRSQRNIEWGAHPSALPFLNTADPPATALTHSLLSLKAKSSLPEEHKSVSPCTPHSLPTPRHMCFCYTTLHERSSGRVSGLSAYNPAPRDLLLPYQRFWCCKAAISRRWGLSKRHRRRRAHLKNWSGWRSVMIDAPWE